MKSRVFHLPTFASPFKRTWPTVLAVCAACLLGACSSSLDTPANAAPAADYAAIARGRVDIEGGLLRLSMTREGTLTQVAAHEGDHVRQGQLLAALDTEQSKLAVDAAQAQLEQAQAQAGLLATRQTAAKLRARRLAAAAAAGAGDGQSADDAQEAVAQLDAERVSAMATRSMATQKLDQARYELKQRRLLSPLDADVVQVAAQTGASVSPTSGTLFTLLPDQPRIIRAELNDSFIGVIHPGMHAEVFADNSRDGVHWSAHVLRIGATYGPATLESDPQVRANARTVECVLVFDPSNPDPTRALRIGQRVTVRFAAMVAADPARSASAPKG